MFFFFSFQPLFSCFQHNTQMGSTLEHLEVRVRGLAEEMDLGLTLGSHLWQMGQGPRRKMTIEAYGDNIYKRITQYQDGAILYDVLAPTMDKWLEICMVEGLIRRFFVPRTIRWEEILMEKNLGPKPDEDDEDDEEDHVRDYCDDGTEAFPAIGPILG
jgi:hypothetical protein